MTKTRPLSILLLALTLAGCGDDDGGSDVGVDTPVDVGSDALADVALDVTEDAVEDAPTGDVDKTLTFTASVDGTAFACGDEYTGLGSADSAWTGQDLRFYVHDIEFSLSNGDWVAMTMEDTGIWQDGTVALLDFEDNCSGMGTTEMNAEVTGTLPAGDYDGGVRFKVGVPESMNHQNAATAGAPLNVTSMFWNWNGGYKFMRIEGPTTAVAGWRFHLGSTLCEGDGAGDATCATANRPEIELTAANDTVDFDIARFFATSALDDNGGAPGCMAGPDDTDCASLFLPLGLPFGEAAAEEQTAFVGN